MNQTFLTKGIEIIGVLFASFGGFFAGIAPPQAADSRFAVGISSFLALIALLLIAGVSKQKKLRKVWLVAACGLSVIVVIAAIYYKTSSDALTFGYPPGSTVVEHIAGTELTAAAREYKEQNEGLSNAQLLAKFGGLQNKEEVWSAASVNHARRKLIVSYMVLVLSISAAIFSLTEGVLGGSRRGK